MSFIIFKCVFITLIAVSTVKSECDSYLECLGSFFDNFFGNYSNHKTETQVGNITVPGFHSVDIETENLKNILSGVSTFVQEELGGNVNFGPHLNIFKNSGNNTAIFVKSITITNNFDNYKHKNISNNVDEKEILELDHLPINDTTYELTHFHINKTEDNNKTTIDGLSKKDHLNEIQDNDEPLDLYYDIDEDDNNTDYLKIDYLDMYKDTTNEYVDLKTTEMPSEAFIATKNDIDIRSTRHDIIMYEKIKNNGSVSIDKESSVNNKEITKAVFPWIAAIFIKNDTTDQFEYRCDGALVSEAAVVTAASCMNYGREVDPNNLLVLLGKSSLQSMSGTERAVKVKRAVIHDNFTVDVTPENDIAILSIDVVTLNEHIQTACLGGKMGLEAITTGWTISGELTKISLEADDNRNCKESPDDNTFCAAYGNDITVCPSYGGIYAVKQNVTWFLRGIRSGSPNGSGICFNMSLQFTDLYNYIDWIKKYSK